MKIVLFCNRAYSFSILYPLHLEYTNRGDEVLWFVNKRIEEKFPFKGEVEYCTSVQEVHDFKSDAIYVPGNIIPHYLRGVKVQMFHGLAGEKKGHFRIRNYFDLYLTQGPYFTERFNQLASKHGDFKVKETGWPKLDNLFLEKNKHNQEREELLKEANVKKIILFAPTFSPSLTSAEHLFNQVKELSHNPDYLILIKFHDLMNKEVVKRYKELASAEERIQIVNDPNILKYLIVSDLMISDTSSVVYEFLLLDKPVVTLNSASSHISWSDIDAPENLIPEIENIFAHQQEGEKQNWIKENYHPYDDGHSAKRMVDAVDEYIKENGIPEKRKLSFLRRYKVNKKFGTVS